MSRLPVRLSSNTYTAVLDTMVSITYCKCLYFVSGYQKEHPLHHLPFSPFRTGMVQRKFKEDISGPVSSQGF